MPYWKEPKMKRWWSFIVDGKCVWTLEQNASVLRDRARLRQYLGIVVMHATDEDLIAANSKTILPLRIINKMSDEYKKQQLDEENKNA